MSRPSRLRALLLILVGGALAHAGNEPVVARLEWEPGAVGRLGTQEIAFSDAPPDGCAPPADVGTMVFGTGRLGDVRPIILGLESDKAKTRFWIDTDMDGSLEDEREQTWERSGTVLRREPTVLVPASGEERPVPVGIYVYCSESDPAGTLKIQPRTHRVGEVVLAGRLRRVALVDENADLCFDDLKRDVFYVDVDADGAFAAGHGTHEHFHFTAPVNIAGEGYDVRVGDAMGRTLEFHRIAEIPPPLRRKWKSSTYGAPGRELTKPTEDLATLRARFEEERGKTYAVRQKTVSAIGRTGDAEAVAFLLAVADEDEDKSVRSAAVRALGNALFLEAAGARVVKIARGSDAGTAGAAIQALYDMGYPGREKLFVDLLGSSVTTVVSSAARYLAYEATDTGRAAVLAACDDASTGALRYQAYMGARYLPGGPPVALMVKSAGSDYAALRARAIEDLERIDHPDVAAIALDATTTQPMPRNLGLALARVLGARIDPLSVQAVIALGGPGDDTVRSEVVKRLRTLRSPAGLDVVMEALADGDEVTRTIAAQVLAGIVEPRITAYLAVRAKKEKDESVLSAIVEALGDHGDPAHADLLIKATKKKRFQVLRRSAIRALARLGLDDPKVRAFFLKLLSSKDWRDRIFAIDAAGASGDHKLVRKLVPMLSHDRRQVRLATVQALGKLRNGDAVKPMIDRLKVEELQRIRNELAHALFVTTGMNLYDGHDLWMQWWNDHGGAFEVPAQIPTLPETKPGGTSASFYGIPIDSDHVTFVIDQSGSMSAADSSGVIKDPTGSPNRLDAAVHEVLRALSLLDKKAYANVILFHTTVQPWKDELVRMDKRNRSALSKHLLAQRPTGGTNLYDGLEAALLDPEVDTVMLLSDGVPGAGKYTGVDEICRAVTRLNQTRRIVIHCVSLGRDSPLLRRLATENAGAYARR